LEAIEDKNAVKVNCINIVTLLINIASDMQLPFESERIASLHADITAMSSISQVEDHLIDFAENIVMGIQNARREKNNTLIDKVLSYINEHMADSTLGLSSLSAQFYTNSSYLSRTFKHKVGYTVVEYLTMQRIKKAKMLLKEGDKMAYEIGEAVGIPDPNYFGKCFKKYAGCSIQEYRKRIELNTGSDTITKNV
jgi:two-component system response regulator YesN